MPPEDATTTTRPGEPSGSTFSANPPVVEKQPQPTSFVDTAADQRQKPVDAKGDPEAPRTKLGGDPANGLAEADRRAGLDASDPNRLNTPLDPNGKITDRPDLERQKRIEAEQLAALSPGTLFQFDAPNGQGGSLTISVTADGSISATIQPDKGNAVSCRFGGDDARRFRAALR